jgi:hypothetical protein
MITSSVMYSYTLHILPLDILNHGGCCSNVELTLDGHSCLGRPEVSKRSYCQEDAEVTSLLTLVT